MYGSYRKDMIKNEKCHDELNGNGGGRNKEA
jgi:hypothetical protein